MTDMVTWLRARFDRDEWDIKHSRNLDEQCDVPWLEPEWITRDRLLAEVAAKRAILDLHDHAHPDRPDEVTCRRWDPEAFDDSGDQGDYVSEDSPCRTVRLLGAPFADRPGYDETWRPA